MSTKQLEKANRLWTLELRTTKYVGPKQGPSIGAYGVENSPPGEFMCTKVCIESNRFHTEFLFTCRILNMYVG